MTMIQPNCRIQFTPEDVDFISRALGRSETERGAVLSLLGDEASRDQILDSNELFSELIEGRGCLRVSCHFYFFVIVRRALKSAGISDRRVADYVAQLLAEYAEISRTQWRQPGGKGTLDYMVDMMAALQTADERTSFFLRAHIGNHSLFWTGLFLERLRYRREYKGFPDVGYYEEIGRMNYRVASDHRLALEYAVDEVYLILAEDFRIARQALNDVAERLFHMSEGEGWIDAFLRSEKGLAN